MPESFQRFPPWVSCLLACFCHFEKSECGDCSQPREPGEDEGVVVTLAKDWAEHRRWFLRCVYAVDKRPSMSWENCLGRTKDDWTACQCAVACPWGGRASPSRTNHELGPTHIIEPLPSPVCFPFRHLEGQFNRQQSQQWFTRSRSPTIPPTLTTFLGGRNPLNITEPLFDLLTVPLRHNPCQGGPRPCPGPSKQSKKTEGLR